MKRDKKISHFLWMVLLLIIMVSCNYLDVVPPETADFKDTMKDRSAALGFLGSCYNGIHSLFYFHPAQYFGSADEFVLPPLWGYTAGPAAWGELSSTNQGDGACPLPWINCYNYLGQCEFFLRGLDELNPTGVTQDDKVRWRAEIKFLMAYYHMVLLDAYGPIPLLTHYYSQNTATSDFPGRSSYDVCVDSIATWFDEAAEDLPATVSEDELGRATSTACKALKARLLLYAASPLWNGSFPYPDWQNTKYETPGYGKQLVDRTYDPNKWQKALDACNDALTWATTKGERSLFNLSASESIRKNEGVPLPNIPNVIDSLFRERVTMMRYLSTTSEDEGNKETIFGSILSDWPSCLMHVTTPHSVTTYNGTPVGGASGVNPLLYTFEHFYTSSGKLPADDSNFSSEADWLTSSGLSNPDVIKLCAGREPRFYAWFGFDGGEYSSLISDGSPLVIAARDSKKQGYNPDLYNRDNSATGFYTKKWDRPNLKYRSSDGQFTVSIPPYPIIRLAELYLDRAECYAALGQTENALADLNVIRERAGVPDLTSTDINSRMSLMDWVRNERFVELWGEGHRYFDLRRWCLAPEYLKAGTREGLNAMQKKDPSFAEFNQRVKVNQPFVWMNRMYLLPITSKELYSNPQLVQAPGY